MNKEEIIKLAREAGIHVYPEFEASFERFAALVAAHKTEVAIAEAYRCGHEAGVIEEREECAKLCEELNAKDTSYYRDESNGIECAAAIRNRGKE